MKKITFLIFVIFTASCVSKKNKILNYNKTIQLAEYNILEENYEDALSLYKKAINKDKFVLAKNCFTAAQVAVMENNERLVFTFLKQGVKKGLKANVYYNDSLLKNYINSRGLSYKIEKQFVRLRKDYEKNVNKFINDTLLVLSELDNKWKIHYMDSLYHIDSANREYYRKKYDSIVSHIVENHLIKLIEKYGYPYHNVYLEQNGKTFGNNRAKLILIHYYSFPKGCTYNNLLKEEVFKGNLLAEHYAEIIDFQAKYGNKDECTVQYFNEWHMCQDSSKNEEIDKMREEFGLRSFEEKIKKHERGKKICKEVKKDKNYKYVKLFYWCG